MREDIKMAEWRADPAEAAASRGALPNEPFPCPYCGQMLAPSCRVCVACKQAIDPAIIRRAGPAVISVRPAQPLPPPVRFPWRLFLLTFVIAWTVSAAAVAAVGLERAQVLLAILEFVSAAWVFYDAHGKRVPKPFRWGVATLLLWIFMFPWYLARRAVPEAPCPFVEAPSTKRSKVLLLVLWMALLVILALRGGPPR